MSEDAKGYVETARDISSVLGAIKSVVKDAKERQGRVYFNSDVPYTPSQEDAFTEMDAIYIDKVSKYNIGLAEILEQNTDVARIPRAVWSELDKKLENAGNAARRTRSAGIQKAQAVAQYALGVQRLKKIADKIKDEPEPKVVSEQLYEIAHGVCKWFPKKDGMHHNKTSAKLLASAFETAVLPDKPIPVYVISQEDLRLPAFITYRLCTAQNVGGRYNGQRDSIIGKLERANIVVLRYNATAANFLPVFESTKTPKSDWDFARGIGTKHKDELLKLLDEQIVKINKALLGESYIPPNPAIKTDTTLAEKRAEEKATAEPVGKTGAVTTTGQIETEKTTTTKPVTNGQNVPAGQETPATQETIETKKDDSLVEAYKKIGELESKLSGIETRMGEQDRKYEALLEEVRGIKETAGKKPNSDLDASKSFLEKVLSAAKTVAGAETETPQAPKPAEPPTENPFALRPEFDIASFTEDEGTEEGGMMAQWIEAGKPRKPEAKQPQEQKTIVREVPQARPVEEWDADARLVYQRMVSMGAELNDGTISFATNVFYRAAAEPLGMSKDGLGFRLKAYKERFPDEVILEKGPHLRSPGKVTMPLGLFEAVLAKHRRKD